MDGTGWPWRVRLYAPAPGGTGYQVIFKHRPAKVRRGSGHCAALRRRRKPARSSPIPRPHSTPRGMRRSPPMCGHRERFACLARSTSRTAVSAASSPAGWSSVSHGSAPTSSLPSATCPVSKWRVEHSRQVMEKGAKTTFSQCGREDLRGQVAAMRKLAWRLGMSGSPAATRLWSPVAPRLHEGQSQSRLLQRAGPRKPQSTTPAIRPSAAFLNRC